MSLQTCLLPAIYQLATAPDRSFNQLEIAYVRSIMHIAAHAHPALPRVDALTIAITRRDIDVIYLVLKFPHFIPKPLTAREHEFVQRFADYLHNPFLFAVKLQSITEVEVDDVNRTSRAAVVAYLFQHRQLVHQYMQSQRRQNTPTIKAVKPQQPKDIMDPANWATTSVAEAEALAFAEKVDAADNPMPLSAIKLGLSCAC